MTTTIIITGDEPGVVARALERLARAIASDPENSKLPVVDDDGLAVGWCARTEDA